MTQCPGGVQRHLFGGDGIDTVDGGLGRNSGLGGEGDDLLILGAGDTATGGEGADRFQYAAGLDTSAPAEITDFNADTDTVEIVFDDGDGADAPKVTVAESTTGETTYTDILADGIVTIRLVGADALEAGDVVVTPASAASDIDGETSNEDVSTDSGDATAPTALAV